MFIRIASPYARGNDRGFTLKLTGSLQWGRVAHSRTDGRTGGKPERKMTFFGQHSKKYINLDIHKVLILKDMLITPPEQAFIQ